VLGTPWEIKDNVSRFQRQLNPAQLMQTGCVEGVISARMCLSLLFSTRSHISGVIWAMLERPLRSLEHISERLCTMKKWERHMLVTSERMLHTISNVSNVG
jgi:hypothetical protein